MTDEFRAAFQRVLDTAASQAPDFPEAVHDVFRLSSQVPTDELAIAMEALTPVLSDSEPAAGIAADLAVLAGALVESGAPAGEVGLEVLRQVGRYGQAAVAFMHAWDKTGGGPLPSPAEVSEAEENRVEEVLGENAPLATVGWWTSLRYGLAAKAMLGDSEVRAAVRADASALEGLGQIVHALSTQLSEFGEVHELLRMAEVDTVLVLDRASRCGFRVRFDGVGDNFQLHTLLADALIGKEGRLLPGTRPDPRWTAACLDAPADPLADVVRGEWDLVGGDGTWVGNEACPGDIPVVGGERVLVLEPQSLTHSWRAGRRHPHIPGSLSVVEELHPDQATAWWSRVHPAGSVRHPLAPPIEHDDTGAHRAPRHFGVAAHFEEVDSEPISPSSLDEEQPEPAAEAAADFLATPEPEKAPGSSGTVNLFGTPEPERAPEPFGATGTESAPASSGTVNLFGTPEPERAPEPFGATGTESAPGSSGTSESESASVSPVEAGRESEPAASDVWGVPPEFRDDYVSGSGSEPHQRTVDHLAGVDPFPAFGTSAELPQPPEPHQELEPLPAPEEEPAADPGDLPPGARLLPPMPPGVSDSSTWAPAWKWPLPPPASKH